jgi:hypothetical protein
MTFADPGSPTSIPWADLLGSLVIVDVEETVKDIVTVNGVTDAIRAQIVVLDGDHAGDNYPDALIFSRGLRSQLRHKIGQKVLGRVIQGEPSPGKNPPWNLAPATDADRKIAADYLATQLTADDL